MMGICNEEWVIFDQAPKHCDWCIEPEPNYFRWILVRQELEKRHLLQVIAESTIPRPLSDLYLSFFLLRGVDDIAHCHDAELTTDSNSVSEPPFLNYDYCALCRRSALNHVSYSFWKVTSFAGISTICRSPTWRLSPGFHWKVSGISWIPLPLQKSIMSLHYRNMSWVVFVVVALKTGNVNEWARTTQGRTLSGRGSG